MQQSPLKKILRLITPPLLIVIYRALKPAPPSEDILFGGDEEAFKNHVTSCKVYAEYGCGSSTQWVMENTGAAIWSVDTSAEWVNKIKTTALDHNRLHINHVNVGAVGDWGKPLDYRMRSNFPEYRNWFWDNAIEPDIVLIDGRFRVACFLTSFMRAKPGCTIIFDDYVTRPHYHIVEEIVGAPFFSGRQAIFKVTELSPSQQTNAQDLINLFQYVID